MRLVEKQQNLRLKWQLRDQRGDRLMLWLAIAAVVHVVLVMAALIRWQVMRHEVQLAGDRRPIELTAVKDPTPGEPANRRPAAANADTVAPLLPEQSSVPTVSQSLDRPSPQPANQGADQGIVLMQPTPTSAKPATAPSFGAPTPTQALVNLSPPLPQSPSQTLFTARPVLAVQPLPGTVPPSPSPLVSPLPAAPTSGKGQPAKPNNRQTAGLPTKSGKAKPQNQRQVKPKPPVRTTKPAKPQPSINQLPTQSFRPRPDNLVPPDAPPIIRREILVPSATDQGATGSNGINTQQDQALLNYITTAQKKVYDKWYGLAQTITSPNARQPVIRFGINRQGQVVELEVVSSSGVAAIDQTAVQTIRSAAPFAPLPDQLGGDVLSLSMQFEYKQMGKK